MHYSKNDLPESWSSERNDGAHVKHSIFEECKTKAIQLALVKLRKLKEEERNAQLAEPSDDDDDDDSRVNPNDGDCDTVHSEYSDRSRAFDDIVPQYISSYMSEQALSQALTTILEKNMIWDIGLQMTSLRNMYPSEQLTRLTYRCFCPCGKIHKKWLRENGVDETVLPSNKLCHKNDFNNTTAFIGHVGSKALDNDMLHVGLWYFLNEMYPLYTKTRKRKVSTFHLPVVETHMYDMNVFQVAR